MERLTGDLFRGTLEKAKVALVWSTTAVPEEEPLHQLALLQLVRE